MKVLKASLLEDFQRQHPQSRKPLIRWLTTLKLAEWRNFNDVRRIFRSADYVHGWVVFNIHGNDFRLITKIHYETQQVIIKHIFTHTDYDRWQP
ncbi:MAG: type II toxin-antitoxin system HigB family toxin [Candidatus Melainabacteria bacterium]|nr:type II toxin-antitoxin system HigB family toxin [Candidatus Melainabacteria bacterium]